MLAVHVTPPQVTGDPHGRGVAIARIGAAHIEAVQARALSALDRVASCDARGWLRELWDAQQRLLPEMAAFVEGLAGGYGLPTEALFAAHARYAVEDRAATREPAEPDGCSAFAVGLRDGRVLLCKTRDNPPDLAPLQSLLRQRDACWGEREIMSVGSFGSAPSASSGINSDGFCMADTAVRTGDLGIGALRYYLMEALLIRCATVAQALDLIRGMPHLGGGTVVMADATGALAAVELGHGAVHVQRPGPLCWVTRTNHFLDPALAHALREPPGCGPRQNSEGRLALLHARLDALDSLDDAAALLAHHGEPDICRHTETSQTLSGAIYEPALRRLHLSKGNPCAGDWQLASLAS
jgi:hypothetical protein